MEGFLRVFLYHVFITYSFLSPSLPPHQPCPLKIAAGHISVEPGCAFRPPCPANCSALFGTPAFGSGLNNNPTFKSLRRTLRPSLPSPTARPGASTTCSVVISLIVTLPESLTPTRGPVLLSAGLTLKANALVYRGSLKLKWSATVLLNRNT